MIVSMTGFGDATAQRDGTHYSVEIRSLNNRFFKATIKLPENVSGLEPELESMLREQLGRGSITYILKMRSETAEAAYLINTQALTAYIEQLQKIKDVNGNLKIDLGALLALPGVCQEPRDESDEIERLTSHLDAFEQACRTGEHAGRKLDFITQEMLREANTIASKANDAQIARHIVEIKGAIDRLKEQVQNVE